MSTEDMKKHLRAHLSTVFKEALPKKTNKRFWPRAKSIKSAIKRSQGKHRRSMIDQECLQHKVEEWKTEDPSANIFYRPKRKNDEESEESEESEDEQDGESDVDSGDDETIEEDVFENENADEKVEDDEEVEDNDEEDDDDDDDDSTDDDDEVKRKRGPSGRVRQRVKLRNSLLFVYQNEEQRRLLKRYGNELSLLDATYKTSRYSLPLFFLVVKTNVDYQIVSAFVIESETTKGILEALQVIKDWNPDWNPAVFMTDYSNEEINAAETMFPGIFLLL